MEEGYGGGTQAGGTESSPRQRGQLLASTSPMKPGAGNSSGSAGNANADAASSTLPPLMKGSRLSVLSPNVASPGKGGGFAPSCGPGGRLQVMREDEGGRWRNKQQAWVEREQVGGGERGGNEEEVFPFLAEDEMVLPDDRFEVGWQSMRRSILVLNRQRAFPEIGYYLTDSDSSNRFACFSQNRN